MKRKQNLSKGKKTKMLLFVLSFCFLMIYSAGAYAQVNVKGTVKASNNEPLTGVNVIVKDTRLGTVTNIDGEFVLARNNRAH